GNGGILLLAELGVGYTAPHQHGNQRQPAHLPVLDAKLGQTALLNFISNLFGHRNLPSFVGYFEAKASVATSIDAPSKRKLAPDVTTCSPARSPSIIRMELLRMSPVFTARV